MQKHTIRLFISEAWHTPFRVSGAMINSFLTISIGSFLGPFIIAQLLNKIQNGTLGTFNENIPLILAYVGTQFYGEVLGWRFTLFFAWTFESAGQVHLQRRIFKHLTHQSVNFHANRFGGSLVSQANKLVGAFERFWDTIIFQLIPSLTSILLATLILAFVFWQYAVVLFVVAIVFILLVLWGSRSIAGLNIKESQANTKITGRLADAMTNILAIKGDGNEEYEAKEFSKLTTHWRQQTLISMRNFLKISSIYSTTLVVLNSSALIAAVIASSNKVVEISAVYLAITYTFTVSRQLWEMNNIMRNYYRLMGDAHDMTEILLLDIEVKDAPQAQKLNARRGHIQFNDVTFSHEKHKNKKALFNQFNLSIKPGEKIGLVGRSGGGKTTLTKLLLRFMNIQDGAIYIDGQNIASVKQKSLRKAIAYVPQEPLLFHRSLAENIAYAQTNVDEKQIIAAAKMANAHEFINKLPEKYATLVGERGVKLSGGQRQRIAIARAMLKNAPILILDEATSALDSESEAMVQDALWKLMEGKTAIVVAHRLSTIQKMDRIIVLENGTIVEEGSHKELIHKNGKYAELWNRQSGGFIDN